jgi:anti-anti-sigma factor
VQISVRKADSTLVVSVEGRLDTLSANDFRTRIEELLDQGGIKIVLDLENLKYVSSAGLRSILVGAKKAKMSGGGLCCCALQPLVSQVFEVSGFSSVIPVFNSLEQALNQP